MNKAILRYQQPDLLAPGGGYAFSEAIMAAPDNEFAAERNGWIPKPGNHVIHTSSDSTSPKTISTRP
ncbi:MAG: hypothetical protein FWD45_07095 [Coriobacteriia bacterium]|nr:hypothetical protein [Coriobacteriia bacterium]